MGTAVRMYFLLHVLPGASAIGTLPDRPNYAFNVDIESPSEYGGPSTSSADYSFYCGYSPTVPVRRKACEQCFSDCNNPKNHAGPGRRPGCASTFPTDLPPPDEWLPGKFALCDEEMDICVCDSHPILDKSSGLCVSGVEECFCWGVGTMFDLTPSGQWCNADESRRLTADECEKAYRTGTDGHVYPCAHNRDASNPTCSLQSSSVMCCDHLCAKLSEREEVNPAIPGGAPWCGASTSGGEEMCKASYWTGADGKTYPCVWEAAAGRRRLLFAMLPRPADMTAASMYDDVGPFADPRDADEAYRYQDGLPLDGDGNYGRIPYTAGGRCRLSLSDACKC